MSNIRPIRVLALRVVIPSTRSGGLLDWFVQRLAMHAGVKVSIELGSTDGDTKQVSLLTDSKAECDLVRLAARINAADWHGTGVDIIH